MLVIFLFPFLCFCKFQLFSIFVYISLILSFVKNIGPHQSAKSQCQGTKVASYIATPETEVKDTVTTHDLKIVSISAMPTYKDKSHEELRLEDYQLSKEEGVLLSTFLFLFLFSYERYLQYFGVSFIHIY